MTEPTVQERANAAAEAERLRNDLAFQTAVLTTREAATKALAIAQAACVEALLRKEPTGPYEADVIRLRAEIAAIDGLATSLANTILRKPREAKPVT